MTHPRPEIKETTVSEDSDHDRDCGTADDHYWVASAPTRTGHDDTEPEADPVDHATAALAARWYARPNDLIGGWCVMPVDQPPSCGVGEVADFTYREIAEHIADLHNARLAGISALQGGDEDPDAAELSAGATEVVMYGMVDAAGKEYTAFGPEDALDLAASTNPLYGPQPRRAVMWTVTTSPPVEYQPAPAATPDNLPAPLTGIEVRP